MGLFFRLRADDQPGWTPQDYPPQATPTTSYAKGAHGKRSLLAKQVAREVCDFAPYEKRAIELLRNSLDKRALRVCKKKLGTHKRAKSKVDELGKFARSAPQ